MKRCIPWSVLTVLMLAGTAFGTTPAWAEKADVPVWQRTDEVVPTDGASVGLPAIDTALTELAKDPMFDPLPVDWTGLLGFYAENGHRALFTTPTGFTELGLKFQAHLPRAVAAGLDLPLAIQAAVATLDMPANQTAADASWQAQTEALLAATFVGTAVDATTLLGDDDARGAGIMAAAASSKDVSALLDDQLPTYYRFWSLLDYLPDQAALYESGGWPDVPVVKKLEPGQNDPAVIAIRARLLVTGELVVGGSADDASYDPILVEAIKLFQRNHGLNDDGVIGVRTIEELNVTAETRLRQVLLNLDRMREEGPRFEARHLIANIPSQEVKVIEDGKVTFYTKAIFGKLQRKSPTLSSVIHTVKLNPDWTVPPKIAAYDEVKRERAQPGFLAAKGFTIYDRNGNVISPQAIDWFSVGPGNFPYTLRQAPGQENALGPVKFDFPNDHSVFLHGTPTVSLFNKQDRFFSSGCVRTEQPIDLAAFMLRDDAEWPRTRIDEVIRGGKTTLVKLKNPLPVHITYMTAWVDESGVIQFRKDAYGYDSLPSVPASVTTLVAMDPDATKPVLRQD